MARQLYFVSRPRPTNGPKKFTIRFNDKEITSLAEEPYLIFSGNEPKHINEHPRETLNESQEATSPEWLARQSGSPEAFTAYFGTSAEEARPVPVRCENMFPAIENDITEAGYNEI
jgi:hypothetical protein